MSNVQNVFLVGAKSLGAYGGYETFVYKLTEYHQNNPNIKYHVACKDVLKFVIGDFDDRNQFQMKARKVIIYYYDQQDFELKVINLITLFGRDIVEKNMDDNKIIFIKIDSNID